MDKIRILFLETLLISFFMVLLIGVEGLLCAVFEQDYELSWYIPLSIVGVAVASSLPSLWLFAEKNGKITLPRIIVHGLMCYAIVMTAGYFFKWYTTFRYFVVTSVMFVLIYILVWLGEFFLGKRDEKQINKALDDIRDEE